MAGSDIKRLMESFAISTTDLVDSRHWLPHNVLAQSRPRTFNIGNDVHFSRRIRDNCSSSQKVGPVTFRTEFFCLHRFSQLKKMSLSQ